LRRGSRDQSAATRVSALSGHDRRRAVIDGRAERSVDSLPVCYIVGMASKTATKDKRRRTTMVPVTTMEEIPVLSSKERERLLHSLKQAEGRIKAGKGIDYDPKTFKDRLLRIYRAGKP